jgi:hypothetical protein
MQEAFMFISARLLIGTLLTALSVGVAHAALPELGPTQWEYPHENDGPVDPNMTYPVSFGVDVDMYDNVAVVGAPEGNDEAGAAAIYVRDSSGHWNRTATLVANDAQRYSGFGGRVALLTGKAVVASRNAIYLFVRQSNGTWLQKDLRTFAGASGVTDLDWQGNLLVVGVGGDAYPNYAFAYDTSQTNVLRKIARVAPADAVKSDEFGARVTAYGSTLVATAPGYNNRQGAAYVYSCSATTCKQTQKIVSIDGKQEDRFGDSVDMNGTYLVIGAPFADSSLSGDLNEQGQRGSAYVFTRSGNAWAQRQTLHPTAEEFAHYLEFGSDLTIQGSRLVVSSPDDSFGHVFEYVLQGGLWSARAVVSCGDGDGESTLSTSLIGNYAIIGAPDPYYQHDRSEVDFAKLP